MCGCYEALLYQQSGRTDSDWANPDIAISIAAAHQDDRDDIAKEMLNDASDADLRKISARDTHQGSLAFRSANR